MDSEATNNAKKDLVNYALFLADSSLIMGHRLSEWTGHGPMIEQDIAITNIALDLIGQARNFYQYAAEVINIQNDKKVTEDDLAYLRDANEFKNLLITELPNGDWAFTISKLFLFSTWQFYFYQTLIYSKDEQLAAIAEKSLKEVTYHVIWSGDWVIRLGDGTEESKNRMKKAVLNLWPYTGEMFIPAAFEDNLKNSVSINFSNMQNDWIEKVKLVFSEATLSIPEKMWMQSGGKNGVHTEHLGYILAEMQFMQRAYPGLEW
ncbi:phenylacetate-CoA oxygenase subunit PaaI [Hanamia caeni]|jgi:ring-1,2-phenylacetyl-CoA epoxidase subunit PaaC|uniref:Phenylacetate-CoA oxygenase subunit PaaI n=1 Tax=Hanamia caeni TaxID=2294116 RepID=A0A3M9NEN9_9BACT|nr:1,2-phenylacetyl-CoA epoxidase subunit PaaC [Hanamia caeni]RNI36270.1 phenylacetate-CoA oxygenase subunit PaaI [Hanamia caeni]